MNQRATLLEGSLDDIELTSMVQTVSVSRRSIAVELRDSGGAVFGTLVLKAGQIVSAASEGLSGLEALRKLVSARRPGRFLVYRAGSVDLREHLGPVGDVLTNVLSSAQPAAGAARAVLARGDLGQLDVRAILDTLGLGRQRVGIELFASDGRSLGALTLKAGQVLSASCGERSGQAAARALLELPRDGRFEVFKAPETGAAQPLLSLRALLRPSLREDGLLEVEDEDLAEADGDDVPASRVAPRPTQAPARSRPPPLPSAPPPPRQSIKANGSVAPGPSNPQPLRPSGAPPAAVGVPPVREAPRPSGAPPAASSAWPAGEAPQVSGASPASSAWPAGEAPQVSGAPPAALSAWPAGEAPHAGSAPPAALSAWPAGEARHVSGAPPAGVSVLPAREAPHASGAPPAALSVLPAREAPRGGGAPVASTGTLPPPAADARDVLREAPSAAPPADTGMQRAPGKGARAMPPAANERVPVPRGKEPPGAPSPGADAAAPRAEPRLSSPPKSVRPAQQAEPNGEASEALRARLPTAAPPSKAPAVREPGGDPASNARFAGARPPAPIIAVTSPKGGAGRSTLALNLAVSLARRGRRVVLVDADASSLQPVLNLAEHQSKGAAEVLEGRAALGDALLDTRVPGLKLIPSGELGEASYRHPGWQALLANLAQQADLVLVDCPAAWYGATLSVLGAASHQLLVLAAEPAARKVCAAYQARLHTLVAARPVLLGVVINLLDYQVQASVRSLEELSNSEYAQHVFDVPIPRSPLFMEASARGVPIVHAEQGAAPTVAWVFETLATALLERLQLERPVFASAPLLA